MKKIEKYPTQKGLARIFGINPATVKLWVDCGCPFMNMNPAAKQRRYRFDIDEVMQWLKGRESKPVKKEVLHG